MKYLFFSKLIEIKVVRKVYADEPKPQEDSFRYIEEVQEEEDPSSILMNEINASKYEVY